MNPGSGPLAYATGARGFRLATALFTVTVLVALAAYHETVASFVQVWRNSDTFAHGFLIVPICLYLVWLKRHELARLAPRPYPLALVLLPALGLAWLVGHATGTFLIEQFTFLAMVPILVVVFFGPQVARSLAFPLGFLFFAVPFGDELQPTLMEFTAAFTVRALQISGVPVVREGLYFATPTGQWRVVEACSGLRFLVSGFALGCLYAHEVYRTTWKRLAFAGLSIVALIIANGVRGYVVVLTGYLSGMRFGRGYEHIAIGWLVFLIVMAALFTLGLAFRDREPEQEAAPGQAERGRAAPPSARPARWVAVAAMALAAVGFWPPFLSYLSRPGPARPAAPISPPEPRAGWGFGSDLLPAWMPAFIGAGSEETLAYTKDGTTVQCYIAFYDRQQQGRELIQFQNVIVARGDPRWRNRGERSRRVDLDHGSVAVRETDVRGSNTRYLVWHCYWFPDEFTASPEWAKLLQAKTSLILRRDHAAVVVLSASASGGRDAARDLHRFVRDMLPSIRKALQQADASS